MVRGPWLLAILAGLLLHLGGCEPQGAPSPYEVCTGSVKALDLETGELFVRAEPVPELWRADRNVPCVATKDSEVYINDRFSGIDEIRVGDVFESVGYWDHDRFVLSLVRIARSQPEPRLPDLPSVPDEASPPTPEE